jgi:ribosomal protein S21
MPIIVKAQGNEGTQDVIRKFKKATINSGIVDRAKARKYFISPSQERAVKKTEKRRLVKRARSLKKMKNVSPTVMQRIYERLSKKS